MAGDLYGLSAADRDVLMRMIQRERANYSANVRSLAPVPRKKIEWKPSTDIKWFWLTQPLYPQSDLSPNGNAVWSATAYEMEFNDTTKQWDEVYPLTEARIYSTAGLYGMEDHVIPCQKRSDGWEIVSSSPPFNRVFSWDNSTWTNGDATNSTTTGFYFEQQNITPTDKSGYVLFGHSFKKNAYPGNDILNCVEYEDASSPSTNGTFDVHFTGAYEVSFSAQLLAARYNSASPKSRGQTTTGTTGAASAGTSHTHDYTHDQLWDAANPTVDFQPKLWRKPSGGSYTEYTSRPFARHSISMVGVSGAYASYFSSTAIQLDDGDRVGLQAVSQQLMEARLTCQYYWLSFRLLVPGDCGGLTPA